MKHMIPVISLLILLIIVACGDGEVKEAEQEFQPQPVPSEYAGLSIEELKEKSEKPRQPDLINRIDDYKGKLVWFQGEVGTVVEGSKANTYQIYVYVTHITEVVGTKVDRWRDPIVLLYSQERGPELKANDMVQFSGIVLSVLPGTGLYHPQYVNPNHVDRPMVNAVKVELVTKSE